MHKVSYVYQSTIFTSQISVKHIFFVFIVIPSQSHAFIQWTKIVLQKLPISLPHIIFLLLLFAKVFSTGWVLKVRLDGEVFCFLFFSCRSLFHIILVIYRRDNHSRNFGKGLYFFFLLLLLLIVVLFLLLFLLILLLLLLPLLLLFITVPDYEWG